jgi:hypothetical protein
MRHRHIGFAAVQRFCLDRFQAAAYFIINGATQATAASLPPCWTLAEIRLGLFFGPQGARRWFPKSKQTRPDLAMPPLCTGC